MKPAYTGNRMCIKLQRRHPPLLPYAAPRRDSIYGCRAGECRRKAMLAVWVPYGSIFFQNTDKLL